MPLSEDQRRTFALIQEANDAAALFSHGLAVTRAMLDDYTNAVSIMSLLALGAEKMLKLTVGLAALDQSGSWPTKAEMQAIGHRVLAADVKARATLRMHQGTAPGHLASLRAEVDADPVLPLILEALDHFGDAGRFYFLDYLGEKPQTRSAPQVLWQGMTDAVLAGDPQMRKAISSFATHKDGRIQLSAAIVGSLTRWWEMYVAAWRTGVIGESAKQIAPEAKLLPHPHLQPLT
jgi:hypothetical protein